MEQHAFVDLDGDVNSFLLANFGYDKLSHLATLTVSNDKAMHVEEGKK